MDVIRELTAIAFVFALLWAALRLLKKRNSFGTRLGTFKSGSRGPQLIESRGKLTLSTQHSLHLIRAGDRQVLIGINPAGFTVIGDLGALIGDLGVKGSEGAPLS